VRITAEVVDPIAFAQPETGVVSTYRTGDNGGLGVLRHDAPVAAGIDDFVHREVRSLFCRAMIKRPLDNQKLV
jgi:hypothetical protein